MSPDPPIRVLAGSPTDEEVAAVAALFQHLALERAVETVALPAAPDRAGWQRTARPLRAPLDRAAGWRDR